MNKTKILIIVAAAMAVAALLLGYFVLLPKLQNSPNVSVDEAKGVLGEPLDVTLDFYGQWTAAKASTTTDPYAEGLATSTVLSDDLSRKILDNETAWRTEQKDVVACDPSVSADVKAKEIYSDETKAQVLIFPKDKETRGIQVMVTLAGEGGYWKITDIACGAGEQDQNAGEFSFDYEGHLLKQSVPAPLNPDFWHIVFAQSATPGYTAPLIFSASSTCVLQDATEKVCSDDMFFEAMKVRAKGDMTEAGLEVTKMELLKY
jgi:hypothetical protein